MVLVVVLYVVGFLGRGFGWKWKEVGIVKGVEGAFRLSIRKEIRLLFSYKGGG